MIHRPRRLRKNSIIRELVAETRLHKEMFIYPYFVVPGSSIKNPIASMPGIDHFSIDELIKDVAQGLEYGVNKILLFGVGEDKSQDGDSSFNKNSIVNQAIGALKKEFGEELYIITDVCVCAYTDHGHCGILSDNVIHNDSSVELLTKMALSHAVSGADMVAPSDMMDGRVGAIRSCLDEHGFENTGIMSYAVKFASSYYGPFREAAASAPDKGDRKSYQMDFRNGREAMKESLLDEMEGADILMVKPALAYLDIISKLRENTELPVACYNVSGEYAMIRAAAKEGLVDERAIIMEIMHSFARAGATIIISYFTREILEKSWI